MLFALAIHPLVCHLSTILGIDISAWNLNDGSLVDSQQGVCSAHHALHNLGPARALFTNVRKTHFLWHNLVLHPSI